MHPFRRLSLRSQMALFFGLLIAALTALTIWATGRIASETVREAIGTELAELAFHMGDKLSRSMHTRMGEVALLTELDVLRSPHSTDQIRRLLDGLQDAIPAFTWVGFLDPSGTVRAGTGGILEGVNISHRPVYSQGVEGLYIGDVHEAVMLDKLLRKPDEEPLRFVDIAMPIRDPVGATVGVLSSHLSWAWAKDLETSLMAAVQDRRGVEMFVLGEDHRVLLAPPGHETMTLNDLTSVANAQTGDSSWTIETWPDGISYLTGYARERGFGNYPGLGWTVVVRKPLAIAYEPVENLRTGIATAGLALTALFALLSWIVADRVARPLQRIAEAAEALRRHPVGAALPVFRGSREVEVLSTSLHDLIRTLTATDQRMGTMERMAHHDLLTGLPNRAALRAHLDHVVPVMRHPDGTIAFLYLDLDGFKAVNDQMGHAAGDALLKVIAERLRDCLRGEDLAVRLGGDEFALLINTNAQNWRQEADQVAARVITSISKPIRLEEGDARVGCSVGIAAWPLDHNEIHHVIQNADTALYAAKHAGKGRAVFWNDIKNGAPLPHHTLSDSREEDDNTA